MAGFEVPFWPDPSVCISVGCNKWKSKWIRRSCHISWMSAGFRGFVYFRPRFRASDPFLLARRSFGWRGSRQEGGERESAQSPKERNWLQQEQRAFHHLVDHCPISCCFALRTLIDPPSLEVFAPTSNDGSGPALRIQMTGTWTNARHSAVHFSVAVILLAQLWTFLSISAIRLGFFHPATCYLFIFRTWSVIPSLSTFLFTYFQKKMLSNFEWNNGQWNLTDFFIDRPMTTTMTSHFGWFCPNVLVCPHWSIFHFPQQQQQTAWMCLIPCSL